MKLAIALAIMTVSGAALADTSGYWVNATGQVVRDAAGTCYHNSSWTPAMAIPGCGDVPLTQPTSRPAALADSDRDGVTDNIDRCPNTPLGAMVDSVGCPKLLDREVVMYLDVKFAFGKHDIEGDGGAEIKKVSQFMKQYPSVKVVVEGYTDDTGPADFNQTLSKERADAVIAVLEANGVAASRLSAAAYGETHPMATNTTPEGRRENRRVMAYAKAETAALEMKPTAK